MRKDLEKLNALGRSVVAPKDYDPAVLDAFAAAVKAGDNVLAVKVTQEVGGQYFDLGLSVDVAK